MTLRELQRNWNAFGKTDPLWAILTNEGKENNRWNVDEFFATGQKQIADAMQYVESVVPELKRGRALDFGCGVGRLCQALAGNFESVTGVDIAPAMIERARGFNRFGERCQFVLNERDDLSVFPSGSFDFAYSSITLQHMAPRYCERYVRELVRVLAPRGILLFQLPSRLKGKGWFITDVVMPAGRLVRKWFSGKGAVMEMYGTPPETVRQWLESEGAEVISITPDHTAGPAWESFRYCARKLK